MAAAICLCVECQAALIDEINNTLPVHLMAHERFPHRGQQCERHAGIRSVAFHCPHQFDLPGETLPTFKNVTVSHDQSNIPTSPLCGAGTRYSAFGKSRQTKSQRSCICGASSFAQLPLSCSFQLAMVALRPVLLIRLWKLG